MFLLSPSHLQYYLRPIFPAPSHSYEYSDPGSRGRRSPAPPPPRVCLHFWREESSACFPRRLTLYCAHVCMNYSTFRHNTCLIQHSTFNIQHYYWDYCPFYRPTDRGFQRSERFRAEPPSGGHRPGQAWRHRYVERRHGKQWSARNRLLNCSALCMHACLLDFSGLREQRLVGFSYLWADFKIRPDVVCVTVARKSV